MKRGWRIARETALTLGAVLGVLSITAALAAAFFGITPLIFRSGSMAPTIDTGALALAREVPAGDIRVHDIVSAFAPDGTRVTHRVESVQVQADGSASLVMRGDANPVADADPYVVQSADRILWHMNGLGYVLQQTQKPVFTFGIGLLVGGMLALSLWPRRPAGAGAGAGAVGVGVGAEARAESEVAEERRLAREPGAAASPAPPSARAGKWAVRATVICAVPLLGSVLLGPGSGTSASFTASTTDSRQLAVPTQLQPSAVTCSFRADDDPESDANARSAVGSDAHAGSEPETAGAGTTESPADDASPAEPTPASTDTAAPADAAQTGTAQTDPAEPDPAEPDAAEPDAAEAAQSETEPAPSEPAPSEPAPSESSTPDPERANPEQADLQQADPGQSDAAAATSAPAGFSTAAVPPARSGTLDVAWVAPPQGAPEFGYLTTLHLTEAPQAGDDPMATATTAVSLPTSLTPGRSYYVTVTAVPYDNWHASTRATLTVDDQGGVSCA